MAKFKISKGKQSNLPTTITEGAVYITTDSTEMLVDVSNTERIRIAPPSFTITVSNDNIVTITDYENTAIDPRTFNRKYYDKKDAIGNWFKDNNNIKFNIVNLGTQVSLEGICINKTENSDQSKKYIISALTTDDAWTLYEYNYTGTEDAVKYTMQQLTIEQQYQARTNIGAGISNFTGDYNDLKNKPSIPDTTWVDF
nr:hypothetical protein DGKKSRWO_DGKKSRWO_CDS_0187 [uncultured phage]CAI9752365.1 hypothetical protein CVNMHQAP_CVNMHQAP_CDS_0188 [uncultured phage]